jgi:HSP20 family molecular chaperone IbpA
MEREELELVSTPFEDSKKYYENIRRALVIASTMSTFRPYVNTQATLRPRPAKVWCGARGDSSSGSMAGASRSHSSQTFSPRFDMREVNDTTYLLDGEVPGISQSDVEIEFLDSNTLVVKGHSRRDYENVQVPRTAKSSDQAASSKSYQPTSPKEVSTKYWVSERQVGQFQRTFTFPARVDQDGVKANLKNGILSIIIPKAPADTAKKIRVAYENAL